MMAATSAAARSASSFTTTWSNSPAAATSVCAMLRRRAMASSDSVPRPRSRWLSSAMLGGALEVGLESGPAAAHLVGPAERVHTLVERTLGGRVGLPEGDGHRAEVYVMPRGQFNRE